MEQKIKQFVGGFIVTAIIIGALCGFMVVDMSTDRYMPDRFGPMFLISALGPEGMEFSFMGERYLIRPGLQQAKENLAPYEGLLPLHMQIAKALGQQAYYLAQAEDLPGDTLETP